MKYNDYHTWEKWKCHPHNGVYFVPVSGFTVCNAKFPSDSIVRLAEEWRITTKRNTQLGQKLFRKLLLLKLSDMCLRTRSLHSQRAFHCAYELYSIPHLREIEDIRLLHNIIGYLIDTYDNRRCTKNQMFSVSVIVRLTLWVLLVIS